MTLVIVAGRSVSMSVGRDSSLTTTHDFSSFYAGSGETSAKKTIEDFNADYGGLK